MQISWSQGDSGGGNDMSPSLAEHLLEQPVLFSSLLLLQDAGILGRHPGVLGSELLAHEVVHEDAHALYQPQEHTADDGASNHALSPLSGYHHGPGRRPTCDGVPGILLLADVRECAVKCGEADTPGRELSSQQRGTLLYLDDTSQQPPAVSGGGIPDPTDHVEQSSTDESHGEGSSTVINDSPGTRLSGILLHLFLLSALKSWRVNFLKVSRFET